MSLRLKKILILSICVLPLLLSFFYQVSNVNANSLAINKDASTGIGSSILDLGNWPDWLNWTIPQDFNLDGKVNILDAIILANAFGTTPGNLEWKIAADINDDGIINILDAISMANHFGWAGTMPSPTTLIVSSTTSLYET